MFSITIQLLSTALSKALNLLSYRYLNNSGYRIGEDGSRQNIHYSGSSTFGDWLTQTVTYHH